MKNEKKRGSRGGVRFSADNQPANQAKRRKKNKTILREAIGLESWEAVQEYILKKGAKKFIQSIHKLPPRQFCIAYLDASEFFKPKLQRTELTGPDGKDLIPVPAAIANATTDDLIKLVQSNPAAEAGGEGVVS